jgi:hypothetical protein
MREQSWLKLKYKTLALSFYIKYIQENIIWEPKHDRSEKCPSHLNDSPIRPKPVVPPAFQSMHKPIIIEIQQNI